MGRMKVSGLAGLTELPGLIACAEYNDIAAWNWQLMLEFFGDKDGKERSREARTKEELEAILSLPEYTAPKSIQVSSPTLQVLSGNGADEGWA